MMEKQPGPLVFEIETPDGSKLQRGGAGAAKQTIDRVAIVPCNVARRFEIEYLL